MELFSEVTEDYHHTRLDVFLKSTLGDDLSRAIIQKWIKSSAVSDDNGKVCLKSNYLVNTGEKFKISIPARTEVNLEPVAMNIPVIAEFENFIVIEKPAGIPTHAGPGDRSTSLVNGLLYQFKTLSGSQDSRPGIIHRLDKPTSGLLVIAKNDKAHFQIAKLFQERKVYKRYYAWVIGAPKEAAATIDQPIARHPVERLKMCVTPNGRNAVTHYKIIKTGINKTGQKFSLLEIEIETGRTHQIRVHLQHLRCPVVGDLLYSRSGLKYEKYGLLLFSQKLAFNSPFGEGELEFELPFPEKFRDFESTLEI